MKHYEQPKILFANMLMQDVLSLSDVNPEWQDDPFGGDAV